MLVVFAHLNNNTTKFQVDGVMYWCSDLDEKEKPKFSCEGIQKDNNNVNYQIS